jgi:replicative DNA helicase
MPLDGSNPEGLLPEDVEKCVLGCMVLWDQAADFALSELTEEDFFGEANRAIFNVIQLLVDEGVPVDIMTLADRLVATRKLETAGGPAALGKLMEIVPHATHIRYYCRIVKDNSERRKLKYISQQFRSMTLDTDPDAVFDQKATIAWMEKELLDLSGIRKDGLKTMRDAFEALRTRRIDNQESAIKTGFAEIDQIVKLLPGKLIILGARPGMGKTAMVVQFMRHVGETSGYCLYISLEMPDMEIAERLESCTGAEDLPILISDNEFEFVKICSLIRMTVRKHRVKLVVIDYLQLMELPHSRLQSEEKIAEMSKTLKRLAKTLKITIVACVQLNRELEKRDDKRPRTSDIRGSGAIEQDADTIAFLYRESAYNPDADPGEAEFIVTKNRAGRPNRTVKLGWIGEETRFTDWSMRPIDDEGLFAEQHFGEGVDLP